MLNTSVCAWIEVVNQICNQIYMVFLRVKKLKKCKYIYDAISHLLFAQKKNQQLFSDFIFIMQIITL